MNMQPINFILIFPCQNHPIPCRVPVEFDFDNYNLTTKDLAFNIFAYYVNRMRDRIIHILKNHRVMYDLLSRAYKEMVALNYLNQWFKATVEKMKKATMN